MQIKRTTSILNEPYYAIHGFGGSDLSPALERLADDPIVEAMVTGGAIDYPVGPPPFAVLWAVDDGNPHFQLPYGQVIALPNRPKR